jgi:hypothetical protein
LSAGRTGLTRSVQDSLNAITEPFKKHNVGRASLNETQTRRHRQGTHVYLNSSHMRKLSSNVLFPFS